jgi:hypothetical protein
MAILTLTRLQMRLASCVLIVAARFTLVAWRACSHNLVWPRVALMLARYRRVQALGRAAAVTKGRGHRCV